MTMRVAIRSGFPACRPSGALFRLQGNMRIARAIGGS
jgi:hypothetical protein